jgi:hypothetical protein
LLGPNVPLAVQYVMQPTCIYQCADSCRAAMFDHFTLNTCQLTSLRNRTFAPPAASLSRALSPPDLECHSKQCPDCLEGGHSRV